jgi:aspartate carbamoyltransferase
MTKLSSINGNFKNQHILSLDQFTTQDIETILKTTKKMKDIAAKAIPTKLLEGNTVALIFYEPSSRTFASFSAAIKKLGGETLEILDPTHFSSAAKGETLEDTIRVFEAYSDAIILRHPQKGKAQSAAEASRNTPIINAGDGIGEHPTQALLDLATIYEKHGKLDNLTGVITGDLLNGRTVHSLIKALSLYKNNTLYLLSPTELNLQREDYNTYQQKGIKLIEIQYEKQIPQNAHFWYWTRVQKERFTDTTQYEKLKTKFTLTKDLLKKTAAPYTILMHPLPRVGEIEPAVDEDPRAVYLKNQIKNGLYVRMALLALVLGKKM